MLLVALMCVCVCVCVCMCVRVCMCVYMRGQSVGNEEKEVMCMCDQITEVMVHG